MATATRRTWTDRVAVMTWRIHSASRPDLWHTVTLQRDGEMGCTCEWARSGGLATKDCKHVAHVRMDPYHPAPAAVWSTDERYPAAWEWAALLARLDEMEAA